MNLKDYLKIRKEKCLYKICGEFIEVEAQQFIILARKQIQKNLNSHLNAQRLNWVAKLPDRVPLAPNSPFGGIGGFHPPIVGRSQEVKAARFDRAIRRFNSCRLSFGEFIN